MSVATNVGRYSFLELMAPPVDGVDHVDRILLLDLYPIVPVSGGTIVATVVEMAVTITQAVQARLTASAGVEL